MAKEGEEPNTAAHVDPDDVESRDVHVEDDGRAHAVRHDGRERSGLPNVKFLFLGPAIGYVVVRRIVRKVQGKD